MVPAQLKTDLFLVRPLTTDDVELDYAAVMASSELLRTWGGGPWPSEGFTLEDNYKDLDRHQREHSFRQAFTYTVMNPGETECLGCLYIKPLKKLIALSDNASGEKLEEIADDEAVVSFWVIQTRLEDNLDRSFLSLLATWLTEEWYFSKIFFVTNEFDQRQVALYREMELSVAGTIQITDMRGSFRIFGPLVR